MENLKLKVLNKFEKGQVMLLTVLVLGASILGVSTIAGYMTLLKIRSASDTANSAKAIFAADTGIEWQLYRMFKDSGYPSPTLSNGASFDVYVNLPESIKSVGQSAGAFRAFEMGFGMGSSTLPE